MGTQINHGAAAAFLRIVEVFGQPVVCTAGVTVVKTYIIDFAQCTAVHDLFYSQWAWLIFLNQRNDEHDLVSCNCFRYPVAVRFGEGQDFFRKNMLSGIRKLYHKICVTVCGGTDDNSFCFGGQEVFQSLEGGQTQFPAEILFPIFVCIPNSYDLGMFQGCLCVTGCMDMPYAADGNFFHSKYTGFPVLLEV